MAPRFEHPFLPSTQDEAVRLARAGAEDGTTVVAGRQGSGRGRLSHTWVSPEGGLYLSIVVREPAFEPGLLSVAVGARLALALRREFDIPCVVKWPNDLLVPRMAGPARKLAGILVDRLPSPNLGTALVVGLGLNVCTPRHAFPPELQERVAILSELGAEDAQPHAVEPLVVEAVRSAAQALETLTGHGEIVGECRRSLYGVGHSALVDGNPAGVIRELGDDGALWLERDGERVAVRAGDLTVLEEA